MTGIGLVLNIAKDALLAQQYALDVVSHNISNVNTDGYSKQTAVISAKDAAPYAGFTFGTGVALTEIIRNSNTFIEKRLQQGQSDLMAMSEKEVYMEVMESIFNESSSSSLSNLFTDFWNSWNDLANNPSGMSERSILTENGVLLAQSFRDLKNDLVDLTQEIDNSIQAGVENINELLSQIADLNNHILLLESSGNANDLRDRRNTLVTELAEYMDINTYESEDGNLTVTTGRGYTLVSRGDIYPLEFFGGDIIWKSSVTAEINITDTISGGRIGGWLEMRDEIIPEYSSNLDELAKSTIWEINKIHSQGVGLEGFTSVTGTYSVLNSNEEIGTIDSGLDFYDKMTDGSFKIWLYDSDGEVVGSTTIAVDADVTTLEGLASTIENASTGGEDALTSIIKNGKLYIGIDSASHSGYSFAFSDDTSNVLAALGINTFFSGDDATVMEVNESIISDKNFIAAGTISNNVGPALAASTNTSTGIITTVGPYTGDDDATYEIQITTDGSTFQWRKDGGTWSGDIAIAGSPSLGGEGVTVTFNGTFVAGDTFTIDVIQSSDTYGAFAAGDNTNALALADLQYQNVTVKEWTYTSEEGGTSKDVTGLTIDEYLHMLVSSIGIKSQSIQREKEYKELIQDQVSETRDSISAVSLDEEMTDLIKFQQAYSAAAKLITVSDEMLDTVLNTV